MRKVKTFFHVLKNSLIPQPVYYRKLLKIPFSFTFKYFFVLVFFTNLVLVLSVAIRAYQSNVASDFNALLQSLKSYPKDLKIALGGGRLLSNYQRPYFFRVKQDEKNVLVAVVDEGAAAEKINEYQSYILFTNKHIVLNKKLQIEERIFPYPQDGKFVLEKKNVDRFVSVIEAVAIWFVLALLVVSVFAVPVFITLGYLVYLLVVSAVCYLVFRLFTKKHSFAKTYQLSFHAVSLPFVFSHLLNYPGFNMVIAPPLFFILVVVFVVSGLYEAYLDKPKK
ncbi:DUF1189 family protein [Candidatus Roizmanbacteria bacterium]|nr:DUF1189 family protein [Candidatus Roizmanbacteria bacterium]